MTYFIKCMGTLVNINNLLLVIIIYMYCHLLFLSYHFHVVVDDGLIFLCMADEDFGKRQPYAFLEEVIQW